MKALLLFVLMTVASGAMFSQAILPPELRWWQDEVQKANPAIKVEDFKLEKKETFNMGNSRLNTKNLYPVFMRWNYSADKMAYFNLGASLNLDENGKYEIGFDIDSACLIADNKGALLYTDSFGSSSGIDAVGWLTDKILVGVGKEIETTGSKAMVKLIVKKYQLKPGKIEVETYTYKNAFDNDMRAALKLNWYEQRPDYFSVK